MAGISPTEERKGALTEFLQVTEEQHGGPGNSKPAAATRSAALGATCPVPGGHFCGCSGAGEFVLTAPLPSAGLQAWPARAGLQEAMALGPVHSNTWILPGAPAPPIWMLQNIPQPDCALHSRAGDEKGEEGEVRGTADGLADGAWSPLLPAH